MARAVERRNFERFVATGASLSCAALPPPVFRDGVAGAGVRAHVRVAGAAGPVILREGFWVVGPAGAGNPGGLPGDRACGERRSMRARVRAWASVVSTMPPAEGVRTARAR